MDYLSLTKFITDKQKKFTEHYLTNGCNGTEAAIAAGYAPTGAAVQASRNLGKPIVLEYMRSLQTQLSGEREGHLLDIEAELSDVYRTARAEHSFQAANRSLELLGKIRGSFAPEKRTITTSQILKSFPGMDGGDDEVSIAKDIQTLAGIAGYRLLRSKDSSAMEEKGTAIGKLHKGV